MKLNNVEVKNCSQKGTWRPAVKFETTTTDGNYIKNGSIHSGFGIGLSIVSAENVVIEDSSIVNHVEHGLWILQSSDITFKDNWIIYIYPQDYYFENGPVFDEWEGWTGCVTISDPNNNRLLIQNNIASACWHHGFHYLPLSCTDPVDANSKIRFEGNVAHTISGNGAVAANVDNSCTVVKDFKAYKCTQSSITLGGPSDINRATGIVSIDVGQGIGIHGGECGNVEILDSDIYGEFKENRDCDNDPNGCEYCIDRLGIVLPSIYNETHKDKETIDSDWMPMFNYSNCFTGEVLFEGLKFHDYYA